MAGSYDVVIAAGVESMSRVPMGSNMQQGPGVPFGPTMNERYENGLVPQGISASWSPRSGASPGRNWIISPTTRTCVQHGRRRRAGSTRRSFPWTSAATATGSATPATRASAPRRRWSVSPASAGVRPRRCHHGGQLVPDIRRCRGRAHHERGEGGRTRSATDGPVPLVRPRRGRPRDHAHGSHPRHREGAGPGRARPGRHRPLRDQRGVRFGRGRLVATRPASTGRRSTSTAVPWPPATPSALPGPNC